MKDKKEEIKNKLRILINEIISNPASTEVFSNLVGSEYCYPIQTENIQNRMIGEKDQSNTINYFSITDSCFYEEYTRMRQLFTNTAYNPYVLEQYQPVNYYVKNNIYSSIQVLFDYKLRPTTKQNILIIGERGSGKTVTINHWLYEHHKQLEQNDIFWVRCNGETLYRYWIENVKPEVERGLHADRKYISLEEYFDIRILYIFAKFCFNDNELLKKTLGFIQSDEPTYEYRIGRRDPNRTETKKIYVGLKELNETINKWEKGRNVRSDYTDYSYKVMYTSRETAGKEKDRWMSLSKALQKFFANKDIWILMIADGVDNIKVDEESSEIYYNNMLTEIWNFNYNASSEKQIHLMALRNTTYSDACKGPQIRRGYMDILDLRNSTIPLRNIWDLRFAFIKSKLKDSNFINICSNLENSVSITAEVQYNFNVRDFLYNKLSLLPLAYYRYKQLGSSDIKKIDEIIKAFECRNLYLNGRLFLNTNEEEQIYKNEHGICFINLFYYNTDTYSIGGHGLPWHGLCATRVLQALQHCKMCCKSTLKEYLSRSFKYKETILEDIIKKLLYYGMVNSSCFNKIINLRITDKGKNYLNNSYSDIITLYYFALDTLLPISFVNKGLIVGHENKFNKVTDFPYTSVCTAITFIYFLINISKIEKDKFVNSTKESNNDTTFCIPEEVFSLPFVYKANLKLLLESIDRHINSANDEEINKIFGYVDKYTIERMFTPKENKGS